MLRPTWTPKSTKSNELSSENISMWQIYVFLKKWIIFIKASVYFNSCLFHIDLVYLPEEQDSSSFPL